MCSPPPHLRYLVVTYSLLCVNRPPGEVSHYARMTTYISRLKAMEDYGVSASKLRRLVAAGHLHRYQAAADMRRVMYRRAELEEALGVALQTDLEAAA